MNIGAFARTRGPSAIVCGFSLPFAIFWLAAHFSATLALAGEPAPRFHEKPDDGFVADQPWTGPYGGVPFGAGPFTGQAIGSDEWIFFVVPTGDFDLDGIALRRGIIPSDKVAVRE